MSPELHPLCESMADDLAVLANDVSIFNNVRDRFPHPYTLANAREFISISSAQKPPNEFAILVSGQLTGVCGIIPGEDVHRFTAEIGYWIGAPFRGRGIASAAVIRLSHIAFERGFERLHAGVYEWNKASCRVLEKAGFQLESKQRRAVHKNGRTGSQFVYVRLNGESHE